VFASKSGAASTNTVLVPQHISVSTATSAKTPPVRFHCNLQSESGLTESANAHVDIINSFATFQPVTSTLQACCQALLESAILESV